MLRKMLVGALLASSFIGWPALASARGGKNAVALKQQGKVFYGHQVMKKRPFEKNFRPHDTYAKIKDARSVQDGLQRSGWDTYIREDWR